MSSQPEKHRAFIPFLLFLIAYTLFYWKYVYLPDVDHGRWMYETLLFSEKKLPYRDFTWQYPPLAIAIYGWAARIFSASMGTIQVVSAIFFAGICYGTFRIHRSVAGTSFLHLSIPSLLFALVYCVRWGAAPLSTGTYSPAQPVGFFFSLLLLLSYFRSQRNPSCQEGIISGVLFTSVVLCKQDFWPMAVLMLGASLFSLGPEKIKSRKNYWLTFWITSIFLTVASFTCLYSIAGSNGILTVIVGYNQGGLSQLIPSPIELGRNVLYSLVLGLGVAALCFRNHPTLFAKRNLKWIGAALAIIGILPIIGGENSSLVGVARGSVHLFFPCLVIIAISLSALIWTIREPYESDNRKLLLFSMLSLSLRIRYGWGLPGWYSGILEMPLLYLFFSLKRFRVFQLQMATKRFFSFLTLYFLAGIVITHPFKMSSLVTDGGTIKTKRHFAETFEKLKRRIAEIDPDLKLSILPLPNEALCYFIRRCAFFGITQGLFMTREKPDDVVDRILTEKPILLLSLALLNISYDHHIDIDGKNQRQPRYWAPEYERLFSHYKSLAEERAIGPWEIYLPVIGQ